MAQFMINHTCGHNVASQLYGTENLRPQRAAWLATRPCLDCQQAQARLSVETWTATHNLKALEGTEKQIAWANKIRQAVILAVEQKIEEMVMSSVERDAEDVRSYSVRVLKLLAQQGKAAFWITRRDASAKSIVLEFIAMLKRQ